MPRRLAFTRIEFLVIVSIILMLAGLFLPSVRQPRCCNEAMGRAIRRNDVSAFQKYLVKDSYEPKHYPGVLHRAAYYGSPDICRFLIEDLKTPVDNGLLLIESAKTGDKETLRLLVDAGAPFDLTSTESFNLRTLLHMACIGGDLDFFKAVLEKMQEAKMRLDFPDKDRKTPLHHAAENGHATIFMLLIEAGSPCDVKQRVLSGLTLLHLAAKGGSGDICRYLLDHDADLKTKTDDFREMPIHFAAGSTLGGGACQVLIDAGANIEAEALPYKEGQPIRKPIDYVRISEPLRVLVLAGVRYDVNHCYNYGGTPLQIAVQGGDLELCKRFAEEGADLNIQTTTRTTLLHEAATKGHANVCAWLIETGADINAMEMLGRTPLMLAAWNNHVDVAKILLQAGADANITDRNGDTAKSFAENFKPRRKSDPDHSEMLELLLRYESANQMEPRKAD